MKLDIEKQVERGVGNGEWGGGRGEEVWGRKPGRKYRGFLVAGLCLVGLACGRAAPTQRDFDGTIVLVSIDGFRWDYMDKAETPNLDRVASEGVRAERLIPAFPTKTFPNHYTIVTGLYPGHHGMIANNMWDEAFQASFSLSQRSEVENARWWGGEPIWVTAEEQGLITATLFWPGSEAPIKGVRPEHWLRYDEDMPNETRVKRVLEWLDLPAAERPAFLTTYFSIVDDAGHRYGPESPQTAQAIGEVDRLIGLLVDGIENSIMAGRVNLIIVSDHGMTPLSPDRVVLLDEYIDMSRVNVIDWAPVLALAPQADYSDEAYDRLQGIEGMALYRQEDLPPRFHYDESDRITPLVGVMDEGWSAATSDFVRSRPGAFDGATHGYDNGFESMHAFFLASGPAFRQGVMVAPFENVEIYNLMSEILGVEPAPNDGELSRVRHLLR